MEMHKEDHKEYKDVATLQINDWHGVIESLQIVEIRFYYAFGTESAYARTQTGLMLNLKMSEAIHIFDEENKNYRTGEIFETTDGNGCDIKIVPIVRNRQR